VCATVISTLYAPPLGGVERGTMRDYNKISQELLSCYTKDHKFDEDTYILKRYFEKYRMIGWGLSRQVFNIGNGEVMKIAYARGHQDGYTYGLACNYNEHLVYHSLSGELREMFCPVSSVSKDGFFAVMKDAMRMKTGPLADRLSIYSKFVQTALIMMEIHPGEIFDCEDNILNGYIIDYGRVLVDNYILPKDAASKCTKASYYYAQRTKELQNV